MKRYEFTAAEIQKIFPAIYDDNIRAPGFATRVMGSTPNGYIQVCTTDVADALTAAMVIAQVARSIRVETGLKPGAALPPISATMKATSPADSFSNRPPCR